jgi:hypothetical protein
MSDKDNKYIFKSTRQGLNKTRGLKGDRNGIIKNEVIFNEKNGLEFNQNKGLKNIHKQIDDDDLFEYLIESDVDKMFKMSPDEREFRNKVYTNYGNLFYDNVDTFNNSLYMIKNTNKDKKLLKDDVIEDMRDIYYSKKHTDTKRNKESKKFQYKKQLKPMENIKREKK